jgi:outer membrane protein
MKTVNKLFILIIVSTCLLNAQNYLTLEKSKELALTNNAKVKNSRLEIESAEQKKKSAFTNYFPIVSVNAMAMKANKSLVDMSIPGGDLPVYDGNIDKLSSATQYAYFPGMQFSLLDKLNVGFATAVQPVFAGGRIVNGNKLASLGVEVNNLKSSMAKNEITLSTEEKFWQLVSLEEKLITIEKYESLLESLVKQVEDAYKSGLTTRNDLLKVRLKISEVRLNKSKLINGRELAIMAFCQYIGLDYSADIKLKYNLTITSDPSVLNVDHNQSLKKRFEYNLLQKSVDASELTTRMKIGEYLPQLGIGVSGYYMKLDKAKYVSNSLIFASLSIPISNWWSGSHEIKIEKLNEEIAANNFKESSDLLLLQMKKAWQDLTDAYKQIALSEDTKAQAEENLKVNEDSYKNGLVTISDLLEAQAMQQQANDQLTDSKTSYLIKQLQYLQVTGR